MIKIHYILLVFLLLVSEVSFSDDFNYPSVADCANKMQNYSLKAHELSEQHIMDSTYMNFFQQEQFFGEISYNKGSAIFARYCTNDRKTIRCVANIHVTCDLITQYPKLWTSVVTPVLEKAVDYMNNNQVDLNLTPKANPFMTCRTTPPSDGSIIDEDHCSIHYMY